MPAPDSQKCALFHYINYNMMAKKPKIVNIVESNNSYKLSDLLDFENDTAYVTQEKHLKDSILGKL